ncbi:hypothetical protein C1J05_05965 [Sulfitobacter sp. JL08]|uniref:glycosyltransferase n=1 Tax=Sulfitobacter sp. JL08 TaxID=2070369 RepID=UPI000E0A9BC6|nr:hypothetical protein C1J05_05965 [Sulfitobacter sp. JL08]
MTNGLYGIVLNTSFNENEPVVDTPEQAIACFERTLKCVTFYGPVHGVAKDALYRASDLFVLPTHTENFGLVVAEALA